MPEAVNSGGGNLTLVKPTTHKGITRMKKQTCIELKDLAFPVKVEQTGRDSFTVTYGLKIKKGLNYARAAAEFGECVFHALACDGALDNS